jgi:hypothetical protein
MLPCKTSGVHGTLPVPVIHRDAQTTFTIEFTIANEHSTAGKPTKTG